MRSGNVKGRSSVTYQRKLDKLKKWHTKRVEARKSWSQDKLNKAKPLHTLEWYVEKLKSANKKEK